MGEQKNTVSINGKSYDSVTGDLILSAPKKSVAFSDVVTATSPKKAGGRAAHHLAHHKQQKSITLKRNPSHKAKSASTQRSSSPLKFNDVATASGTSDIHHSQNRLSRAMKITKSASISRFNPHSINFSKRHEPLSVQQAPNSQLQTNQTMHADRNHKDDEIINNALRHANSHNQAPHKTSRRKHRITNKLGVSPKVVNVVAGLAIVILLGGFIAYQNASNIAFKVAAGKSGVTTASLPGYQPSGFSLNRNIGSSAGQITLKFHSNSDDRNFTITQSSSNWDSQTLADSYLVNKQAQKIEQNNGKTVYIYGKSDATWVDGGTWYRIEGNSSLTNNQLLKIANSF